MSNFQKYFLAFFCQILMLKQACCRSMLWPIHIDLQVSWLYARASSRSDVSAAGSQTAQVVLQATCLSRYRDWFATTVRKISTSAKLRSL